MADSCVKLRKKANHRRGGASNGLGRTAVVHPTRADARQLRGGRIAVNFPSGPEESLTTGYTEEHGGKLIAMYFPISPAGKVFFAKL